MADCRESAACAPQGARQRGTLKMVLSINAVMFAVVLAAGLFVLAQVAYRAFVPALPAYEAMGAVSLLALAALLLRFAARVVRASAGSLRETRASGRWQARASQARR